MDKLRGCFLSALLLLAVSAQEKQNIPESGTLQLGPEFPGEITSIQWKHNSNLVAEWVKDVVELLYYGGFNGRTTLDISTGDLEIRKMNLTDSGVYTVEINNKVQPGRYNVVVIKAVPKPDVLVQPLACTPAFTDCSLTCDGDTKRAGPVTYSWKMGEGEKWVDGEKIWRIINDETIQSVEKIYCRMNNSFSDGESDPKHNPFFIESVSGGSGAGWIAGIVVLILVIVAGIGYWRREDIKKILPKKSEGDPSPTDGKQREPEEERLNEVSTIYDNVQKSEDRPENGKPHPQSDPNPGEANDGKTGEENDNSAL